MNSFTKKSFYSVLFGLVITFFTLVSQASAMGAVTLFSDTFEQSGAAMTANSWSNTNISGSSAPSRVTDFSGFTVGASGKGIFFSGDASSNPDDATERNIATKGYSLLHLSYSRAMTNTLFGNTALDNLVVSYSFDGGSYTTLETFSSSAGTHGSVSFDIPNPNRHSKITLRFVHNSDNNFDKAGVDDVLVTGENAPLFYDGFESDNFTAGTWTTVETPTITSTNSSYYWTDNNTTTSGHAAVLDGSTNPSPDDVLEKSFNTTGYENITVSYARRTQDFELNDNDNFTSYYSLNGGTNWTVLETITSDTNYARVGFSLPAGANNNPNFKIRFEMNGDNSNDNTFLDDVIIGGTVAVGNPVPTTTDISPTSATVGASGFTLTVNGTNFVNGSVVRWNGADRTTTYVSATQLTASISSSDVANAGTASVTVFNPAPTGGTSGAQTFTINKATPIISWNNPASIVYGTALSETQLNAQLSVPGSATYTPDLGTILDAGTHTLSVHFVPTSTANYNTPTDATISLVVTKAQPVINWENPADVVYTNSTLGETQLNATVTVPGPEAAPAVTYSPISGTVLSFGNNQTLTANTGETANYLAATKNVSINVIAGPATTAVISADTTTKEAPGTVILTSTLRDADNHLVVNGTAITLASTFGTVDGVGTSVNGVILRSLLGTQVGVATLSIDGLTVSGDTTITFQDTKAPVITLTGADSENKTVIHLGDAYDEPGFTAIDAVDGDVTENVEVTGEIDENTLGNQTLTYSVTDTAGNTGTVTRTVVVVDAEAPILTLNGDAIVTVEAGTSYTDLGATAEDNVDTEFTIVTTVDGIMENPFPLDVSVPRVYFIRYNTTDAASNVAEQITREVRVVDTTAPVVTLNGDATIHLRRALDSYTEQNATATDLGMDLTSSIVKTGDVNTSVAGTYEIKYSATDASMNVGSTTRTVIVRELGTDATLSSLTLGEGQGILSPAFSPTIYEYTVQIRSNYEGTPEITGVTTDQFATQTSATGEDTRSITVQAENPETPTKTYTVTFVRVVDTTAPVITILGNNPALGILGRGYEDAGATAFDNIDGNLGNLRYEGEVDTDVAGEYIITYRITDASGNESTATRTVVVREPGTDATLSALSLSRYILVPAFSPTIYEYTVVIPYDAETAPTIYATTTDANATKTIVPPYNIESDGKGRIGRVEVVSEAGEEYSNIYTIIFNRAEGPDTTAPVVTLIGDATITLLSDEVYTDSGATAFDSLDGDVTPSIITTNPVNTSSEGTYAVVYEATDSAGNKGYGTRTVEVRRRSSGGGSSRSGSSSGSIVVTDTTSTTNGTTTPTTTPVVVTPTEDTTDDETPVATRFIGTGETGGDEPTDTTGDAALDATLGLGSTTASTTASSTQAAAIAGALGDSNFVTYLLELIGAVLLGYGIYYGLVGRKKRLFEKFFGFKANPQNEDVVREVKKTLERLQARLQGAEQSGDSQAIETAKAELARAMKIAQGRGHGM